MALMLVLMDNSLEDGKKPETEPKIVEMIKKEFNSGTEAELPATKCGICGDPHYYRDCNYVVINSKVSDNEVISRARLSLPDILEVKKLADETDSVFALNFIQAGTEFGPFIAKRNLTLHPSATFPIKVFTNNESDLSEYYLDSTDENECCWMMFVKPANDIGEQNLICYQEGENIYFGSIRDIEKGEELKVWYSPYFAYKMQKITLTFKDSDTKLGKNPPLSVASDDNELTKTELNKLIKDQQRIIPRAVWNCKFCSKLEKNVTDFAKHLLSHYVVRKKNICKKCQIGFRCPMDYSRHLKLIHSDTIVRNDPETGLVDNKKDKVKQKTSKISNQENSDGEPLLTQYVSDNLDNSNSFLTQPEPDENIFDLENYDNQTALFDEDNLRLNLDVIGSATIKDLDELDIDAKHPNSDTNDFVCDICLKRFSSVRLVALHLRFHAGQYFCSNCKRIFGRLENLKQHKCNFVVKHKCLQCNKLFYQKKYLTHHISVFHEKKFDCRLCGEKYYSSTELKGHSCKKADKESKTAVKCTTCGKQYNSIRGLNIHMNSHKLRDTAKISPKHICSECSETFSSSDAYRRHVIAKHEKPQSFDCRVCDKKFSRKDILKRHIMNAHTVDESKMFPCPICKKEFKVKHYLDDHIKQIHDNSKYYCDLCNTSFKFSRNLQRHRKLVHSESNCRQGLKCPVCNAVVKLKGSLLRHIRKKHPEVYKRQCADHQAKLEETRTVKYKCVICNREVKSEVALLRHIKMKHPEEGKNAPNRGNVHLESVVDKKKIKTLDEEFDNYMDLQKTIENMDFSIDTCNENLFSGSETIDRFIKERSDQISIFCADSPRITALPVSEVNAEKSNNREVGLSMPDLSDLDPDAKLMRATPIGNNFESPFTINAIDDVVLYVLNEKGN